MMLPNHTGAHKALVPQLWVGNRWDLFNSAAMQIRHNLDSDSCPVSDEMLGDLYRVSKNGLAELIANVSPDLRAALAIYCYRRGHLKGIGLAIASTCNQDELEFSGGTVGCALFARSREVAPLPPVSSDYERRKKITLATRPLRSSLPIDDNIDLEPEHVEHPATRSVPPESA